MSDKSPIPEHRLLVYEEAERLAVLAFDPEFLNRDQIVVLPGEDMAALLVGWNDDPGAWEVRIKCGDSERKEFHLAVGCVCDYRYFGDFLIGRRGRVIAQSGDTTYADAEVRFQRFEKAGGVFGSEALRFVGMEGS